MIERNMLLEKLYCDSTRAVDPLLLVDGLGGVNIFLLWSEGESGHVRDFKGKQKGTCSIRVQWFC